MNSSYVTLVAQGASRLRNIRGLSCAVVLGVVASLASCSHETVAQDLASVSVKQKQKTPVLQHVKGANIGTEDAKAASAKGREYVVGLKTVTQLVAYGRGPYICSPSGFGRASHCVARSSFN